MWCGKTELNSNIIPPKHLWLDEQQRVERIQATVRGASCGQSCGLINWNKRINEGEWGRRVNIMTFPEWVSSLLMWCLFPYAGNRKQLSYSFINSSTYFTSSISAVTSRFLSFRFALSFGCGLCHVLSPVWEKVKTAEESHLRPRAMQSNTCQPIRALQKPNK